MENLPFTGKITVQDREPNYRDEADNYRLYLVHCYDCDRQNKLSHMAKGRCYHCGWDDTDN